MKIIVSHDIDHISVLEHYKDLIVPKHLVRNQIEFVKGKITFKENTSRFNRLFSNKWENINEVMDFNDSLGIKSNFFMGVNKGLGLVYSSKNVEIWSGKILSRGFGFGIHGIDYDDYDKIKREFDVFKEKSQMNSFGIRMHYLRRSESTLRDLSKAGYLYDCTEKGFINPYKVGEMWEFPLQIMEGWMLFNGKRYQNLNFEEAKLKTLGEIEKAIDLKLEYLNVLFHDFFYTTAYQDFKKWYEWVLLYLKGKGFEFITYEDAVKELNQKYDN